MSLLACLHDDVNLQLKHHCALYSLTLILRRQQTLSLDELC